MSSEDKKNSKDESKDIVLVSEIVPEKLNILPLLTRPIFPNVTLSLTFTGPKSIAVIKDAMENNDGYLGLVLTKNHNDDNFLDSELYDFGTMVKIFKTMELTPDSISIVIQGKHRFQFVKKLEKKPFLKWEVKPLLESESEPDPETLEQMKPYILSVMDSVRQLFQINPVMQEQIKLLLSHHTTNKPRMIIDLVSSLLSVEPIKLQNLLETLDLQERVEKLLVLLQEEIDLLKLQEKIQNEIKDKVDKQQKEYFLKEQLKVIKRELGLEKDDKTAEIEKFRKRIEDLTLTEEAQKVIQEEIEKLRTLDPHAPEYQVTRNYLNELTSLPWGKYSTEQLTVKEAAKILDKEHYGLEDVKERILQFISTIYKRGKISGSIICLVGPPGVGKTSIGKSIASALSRKFYRFSVGGMRDEAEIKGHRRTYIGAMPGKIIQSLKRTGEADSVIMLDEIDKIGSSYHGDPSSALLEVLDPEQNKDFLDHFLDVRFDLSNILFITTANQLDTIPRPLLDRMEVIKLSGYILEEKMEIAKRYLIPNWRKEHGLKQSEINITEAALKQIIDQYAREAGVRSLENKIKKIMRKATFELATSKKKKISINQKNITSYLGKPIFNTEELYDTPPKGVVLGLAWTAMGGTTLYIEASAKKGKSGGIKQTGQLGSVMKESCEIAYSYISSKLSQELELNFFDNHFIHLHVPAGATPKDGPSAGITMALALYSLAMDKPVRKKIAMTGELTLTGKVLPIGGVKEKVIAAKRLKLKEVILPSANKEDYEELPAYIKKGIKAHFVNYFDDVLNIVYKK